MSAEGQAIDPNRAMIRAWAMQRVRDARAGFGGPEIVNLTGRPGSGAWEDGEIEREERNGR